MKQYLSFTVWTTSDVVAGAVATAFMLGLAHLSPWSILSTRGAIAGTFGALTLQHLSLHGWTLWKGTVAQKLVLVAIWLLSVLIGGLVPEALGLYGSAP